jgi:transcription elongation factor Elf1
MKLDNLESKLECPGCGFANSIRLRQALLGDTVVCRSCGRGIQLCDEDGSVQRGLRDFENAIGRLRRDLARIR